MKSAKGQNPYRRVISEKVTCPLCGKSMSIRNLHYRHRCRAHDPPPEKLERMRSKARNTAIEAHAMRMNALQHMTAA
jgi:hypothetical protein